MNQGVAAFGYAAGFKAAGQSERNATGISVRARAKANAEFGFLGFTHFAGLVCKKTIGDLHTAAKHAEHTKIFDKFGNKSDSSVGVMYRTSADHANNFPKTTAMLQAHGIFKKAPPPQPERARDGKAYGEPHRRRRGPKVQARMGGFRCGHASAAEQSRQGAPEGNLHAGLRRPRHL